MSIFTGVNPNNSRKNLQARGIRGVIEAMEYDNQEYANYYLLTLEFDSYMQCKSRIGSFFQLSPDERYPNLQKFEQWLYRKVNHSSRLNRRYKEEKWGLGKICVGCYKFGMTFGKLL